MDPTEVDAATGVATAAATKKTKKAPPTNLVIPPKAKPLTKAERRALQESQRAAKAGGTHPVAAGTPSVTQSVVSSSDKSRKEVPPVVSKPEAAPTLATDETTATSSLTPSIVSHLPPPLPILFETGAVLAPTAWEGGAPLPPAVIQLGYAYATGAIRGGNARCRAMLDCFATLLTLSTVSVSDARSLVDPLVLKPAFTYWTTSCRPHSVSMGNAYAFLKTYLQCLDRDLDWNAVVPLVLETMQAYQRERIEYALTAIAETACTKLLFGTSRSDVVILTYGHSEAVCAVLEAAASVPRSSHDPSLLPRLRVICADSPPLWEGRRMLDRLRRYDTLECSYIPLSAVTYVLPTVTKVLLGAAALQSDGSCTGRIGTAVVAMMAAPHCPVLVCAETHKISNRGIQLESIAHNEVLRNDTARRLDLLYDLTPAVYVSGIVTELGIVPPSSIAVLLREMNQPPEWKR